MLAKFKGTSKMLGKNAVRYLIKGIVVCARGIQVKAHMFGPDSFHSITELGVNQKKNWRLIRKFYLSGFVKLDLTCNICSGS